MRKANQHDSEEIPGEFYNEYRKAIRGRSASELLETDLILETDLSEADLSGADLSGADLEGAQGVTKNQLEQQGAYLEGATMRDGQNYEDWIKDKEGSGQDVENE